MIRNILGVTRIVQKNSHRCYSDCSVGLRMSCTKVNSLHKEQVQEWFASFDTVMTDCDGVLWVGSEPIPGSPELINRFRALGKRVFYVTNNSTKHRREYKDKVDKLGFGGDLEDIIGTAYLAASYLEDSGFDKTKKVYIVGSSGITQELDDVGIQYLPIGPDADGHVELGNHGHLELDTEVTAVIAAMDLHISFTKLLKAASYLSRPESIFLATNTDAQFPMKGKNIVVPGTGSMVAAVATAAGRQPIVLGKPNKLMFEIVQRRHPSVVPERTLMIGDRADTDILLGKNCGLQTLMVGSGVHSFEKVEEWEASDDPEHKRLIPEKFIDKLGDLLDMISHL